MKIIILGAGQVGSSVAANLVNEDNDITLVDISPTALQSISERFDLRTITGVASHPSVLEKAYLMYQLEKANGNVSKLANEIGIERTHLYRKLKNLGINLK